jgi:hypothetical protein
MMLRRLCAVAIWVAATAHAQISDEVLGFKIAGVRYPPLGESARVQGDIHLDLSSGAVSNVSGPPLLRQTAIENAKAIAAVPGVTNLELTYHFLIVDTANGTPAPTVVQRGNRFERAVLRALGLKTEKVVMEYTCKEGVAPPNVARATGAVIEIWIFGRTRCLQTEAAF